MDFLSSFGRTLRIRSHHANGYQLDIIHVPVPGSPGNRYKTTAGIAGSNTAWGIIFFCFENFVFSDETIPPPEESYRVCTCH